VHHRKLAVIAALLSVNAALPAGAFEPDISTIEVGRRPGQVVAADSPNRGRPDLSPYRKLGSWIDIYNAWVWNHPEATVRRLAKRNVTTLYLQTSNWGSNRAIYRAGATSTFINEAHARGMKVVAWYVPSFTNIHRDFKRVRRAIDFETDRGERFDSFALDIESTQVESIAKRNRRLLDLARRTRRHVGGSYALGAIVPDVQSTYWPYFPYEATARLFDVFMPMGYFTFRVKGEDAVRSYTARNFDVIRDEAGKPKLPVHAIGGIAGDTSAREVKGFVDAIRSRQGIGGSFYDFPITREDEWKELQTLNEDG